VQTLEDTPFYARSLVNMMYEGKSVTAVHESLSMTRFRQSWVHMLLPFRMPRISGPAGA
jgi:carotenoid 1,2-hydratase